MTHDNIHTCSYSCERPACIRSQRDELAQRLLELVAEAVAQEREACAKVCEEHGDKWAEGNDEWSNGQATAFYYCAIAIRARGET